ncbi:DUF4037 domain-containing protein [Kineococcus sp. NBC_00420]|uniref:DUF4037 domain-containing protein n=1 Tax=Kineococcus sp. NBC_00420 TaxID=2903564 RepID=UPI002E22B61F
MSGAELARSFHDEVVAPLLRREFPAASWVTGRFGGGSDVLRLDDEVSTDHDWGLRLTVLTAAATDAADVARFLEEDLPEEFHGAPVRFPTTWDAAARHRVEVAPLAEFVAGRLGVGPEDPWSVTDWLAFTGQAVLEVVAGPVFADDEGRWAALRDRLRWYPDDVWRHLVACSWKQLEQELPFVGRAGSRGDDLGSRVVAARLVDVAVRLGLLLDRVWVPYPKWIGTVFARSVSGRTGSQLTACLTAPEWRSREAALCRALEGLRERQREVGLPVADVATGRFHDREFQGVPERASEVVLETVEDPRVRALPVGVGSVDQWVSSVDLLVDTTRRRSAQAAVAGRASSVRGDTTPAP